jgi:hypothetical protein
MVRCGGGYEPIDSFVKHVEGGELERLRHLFKKSNNLTVFTDLVRHATGTTATNI